MAMQKFAEEFAEAIQNEGAIFGIDAHQSHNFGHLQALEKALKVVVKRFPTIAARLRKGAFWYYLQQIAAFQPLHILTVAVIPVACHIHLHG